MSGSSEKKDWAREHYRGVEDSLKTAFSPDFASLDEEGIRLDIRHSIRNGFFAAMCSSTYTTLEEQKRFLDLAVDEAAGRILVGVNAAIREIDDCIALMQHGEAVGASHAFIEYPRHLKPESADEVYRYLRRLTDATGLAIVLYGYSSPNLRHLHPSGMLIDVYDRIADVPNVIGMKLTQPINVASAFELADRLGDRILLGPANVTMIPALARHHRIQWVGQWVVESLQSPERPYLVEFMDAVNAGDLDRAMGPFWQMMPAYNYVHDLQRTYLLQGSHPWSHINYYHWFTGGNGGLPRGARDGNDGVAVLDAAGRDAIRERFRQIGIAAPDAPEEEFVVGKAAYARGVRAGDMVRTPLYA